jgi:hypothetical protein
LAPEDAKIVEGWLTQDPMAALGAEAVGIRAIRLPEDTYTGAIGWAPRYYRGRDDSEVSAAADIASAASKEQMNLRTRQGVSKKLRWAIDDWIQRDKSKDWKRTNPYKETIRDLMFDKRGILQPYIAYGGGVRKTMRSEEKKAQYLDVLFHELRHIGDSIIARQASVDDDIVDADTGKPIERQLTYTEEYDPDRVPREARGIKDEPYQRLVDSKAAEYLKERGLVRRSNPWVQLREKHGYIPERYPGDPFTTGDPLQHPAQEAALFELLKRRNQEYVAPDLRDYMTKIRADKSQQAQDDPLQHPAQGAALMELNRRLERDPLEGMDAWLQRHGR